MYWWVSELLVIHDPHVAGHNLVLQARSSGDVDPVSMIGDDDDCAFEADLDKIKWVRAGIVWHTPAFQKWHHRRLTSDPAQEDQVSSQTSSIAQKYFESFVRALQMVLTETSSVNRKMRSDEDVDTFVNLPLVTSWAGRAAGCTGWTSGARGHWSSWRGGTWTSGRWDQRRCQSTSWRPRWRWPTDSRCCPSPGSLGSRWAPCRGCPPSPPSWWRTGRSKDCWC